MLLSSFVTGIAFYKHLINTDIALSIIHVFKTLLVYTCKNTLTIHM